MAWDGGRAGLLQHRGQPILIAAHAEHAAFPWLIPGLPDAPGRGAYDRYRKFVRESQLR